MYNQSAPHHNYDRYYPHAYPEASSSSAPRTNGADSSSNKPPSSSHFQPSQPQPQYSAQSPPPSAGYGSYSAPPSHYMNDPAPQSQSQPPPSQPHSQWSDPGWNHYSQNQSQNQSYQSQPGPPSESSHSPTHQTRAEASSTAGVHREYTQGSASSGTTEPTPPQSQSQLQAQRKPKYAEGPSPSPPALDVDYNKIMEIYQSLLDTARSLASAPDPSDASGVMAEVQVLDQMLQSANQATGLLKGNNHAPNSHSVVSVASQPPPSRPVASPEASKENVEPAIKSSVPPKVSGPSDEKQQIIEDTPRPGEGHICIGCGAGSTPEWRRGPLGPRTLCNACGLVYAKMMKKRAREKAKQANGGGKKNGQNGNGDEASSEGSDDDDVSGDSA